MKSYAFRTAKIVGTATTNGWSQIHTFTPEEIEKKEKRGTLLAVIMFSKKESEVEALNFGREIISRLHEEYYGDESGPILPHLTAVLKKINEEFGIEEKLEVVSGVITNDVLYLAILGGGKILMKRGESLEVILASQVGQIESASGYLQDGDWLVFGTSDFYAALPEGVLRASLENETVETAAENIIPMVCNKGDDSLVAGLLLKITGEVETETAVVEEETLMMAPEPLPEKKTRFNFSPILRKISALFPQKVEIQADYREESRRRKVVFTVAIGLIILLSISIFFGKEKRQTQEKSTRFAVLEQEITKDIEESKSILALNPLEAKDLLFKAQEKFKELESLGIEKEKTASLNQLITETLPLVIKEHQIDNPDTFFDLALLRQEGQGEALAIVGSQMVVMDTNESLVFSVNLDKKSGEILAGNDIIPSAKLVTNYTDLVFVLNENGITRINLKSKKSEIIVKSDVLPDKVLAMKAFGGNLYLINKDNIWRITGGETGYSSPKTWLSAGSTKDFSNISSMAIDGAIWVIDESGKIQKFVQGNDAGFGITGLDKNLAKETLVFTDSDAQNLYLLDKGNQRIVVLGKNGLYQSQYLWSGFSDISDFVVSEKLGKIFLLQGSKILSVNIQ
jgi:hypothetical protein